MHLAIRNRLILLQMRFYN